MLSPKTTIVWCKQERDRLTDQLKAMKEEKFSTRERKGISLQWEDTTAKSIEECERKIAELDTLIDKDAQAA